MCNFPMIRLDQQESDSLGKFTKLQLDTIKRQ